MNTDLLIEGLEKVIGQIGDANWWVNQIADQITEITDDNEEQIALAEILDTLHTKIARIEIEVDALQKEISDGSLTILDIDFR